MRTRYYCALDGCGLSDIADEIIIHDISYIPPAVEFVTSPLAGKNGQRLVDKRTGSQSVEITFEIHDQRTENRAYICEQVQKWALAGGWLTTDDKPGKRLRVVCESLPVINSALRWTQAMKVTFTAFECPFWEDSSPLVANIKGNGGADVFVPGIAAPALVSGRVRNDGTGTINTVNITAGKAALHFAGLALPAGGLLEFGEDERGIFYAKIGDRSVLAKRTPASSDTLRMEQGKTGHLSVSTDGTASTKIEIRGRYY